MVRLSNPREGRDEKSKGTTPVMSQIFLGFDREDDQASIAAISHP